MADPYQMRQEFFRNRRADADRTVNAQQQEASEAINRRFASIGQSGGGAAIAAQTKLNDQAAAQRRAASADVDAMELQANEADIGRGFQSAEADKARAADTALKTKFFDVEQGNKLRQLDLADKTFLLAKDEQEFNKTMARIQAGKEDPGMLGSGGFLGTGLGGSKGLLGTGLFRSGK